MSIPCDKTFLLVTSSRSSVKVKDKYQGHSFLKNGCCGCILFVLHKHILFCFVKICVRQARLQRASHSHHNCYSLHVCPSVLPSGFVKTSIHVFMDGFQNDLTQLFCLTLNHTILSFNPFADDKILDWSKLKQIADDILKCI